MPPEEVTVARRSIYSARQSSPSTYDTSFADFLDSIPQLVGQYQQNKLALEKQELADKRYEDSVARQTALDEQNKKRYEEQQERLREQSNRENYRFAIEGVDEFDYKTKANLAKQYRQDNDYQAFLSSAESQEEITKNIRSKINSIQNLPSDATFYDFEKFEFSPDEMRVLKEDTFAYNTYAKEKNKYDTQRQTGMRSLPANVKVTLDNANKLIFKAESKLIDVLERAGLEGFDIEKAISAQARGEDYVVPSTVEGTDITSGEYGTSIKNIQREILKYRQVRDAINSEYRIKPPEAEVDKIDESDEGGGTQGQRYAFGDIGPFQDSRFLSSPEEASENANMVNDMFTVITSEDDTSPEYKKAMEGLTDVGAVSDITISKPLPGILGTRERFSIRGKDIAEGASEDTGFRIRPDAKAFKLPPEGKDNPEYYERVANQFFQEVGDLQTLVLNPEQYSGRGEAGASSEVVDINKRLRTKDALVDQVISVYKQMPKTAKFKDQIKKLKDIIEKNPKGLEVYLDKKARKGKGEFKFRKGKISQEDKRFLASLNKDLQLGQEPEVSPTQNLIDILNRAGVDMPLAREVIR